MRLTSLDPVNKTVIISHDNHSEIVSINSLPFLRNMDDTEDIRSLVINCPVADCGNSFVLPITGGNDPVFIQKLFIYALLGRQTGRSWKQAKALVKIFIQRQPGSNTWYHENLEQGV